ncbi:preprotein translocase subunit YajC [Nocardioides dongkuii]|uniref:preprotein translocase subunit YajC n=1 Tax=Nocardioides dongkuii TaxID=2760089 RepID=UPI001FD174DB|nr:preprotein translocase subunit YajC [Nocardioides dongkuii]
MQEIVGFLPIIGIALLFWLLIIRPASKRQRELSTMQQSLEVGDEVMLTSGVFASVEEIADDYLRVEIADGVTIKVVRGAVGSIIQQPLVDDEPEEI